MRSSGQRRGWWRRCRWRAPPSRSYSAPDPEPTGPASGKSSAGAWPPLPRPGSGCCWRRAGARTRSAGCCSSMASSSRLWGWRKRMPTTRSWRTQALCPAPPGACWSASGHGRCCSPRSRRSPGSSPTAGCPRRAGAPTRSPGRSRTRVLVVVSLLAAERFEEPFAGQPSPLPELSESVVGIPFALSGLGGARQPCSVGRWRCGPD